jgi:hypothetical protein
MALLTNDKNLVKEFVRINFINSLSSFPNWDVAEQRHLLPLIGEEMYAKLVAIAADNAANDQDKELLKKVRAVIAPLSYLIELPLIHSQLTDAGLRVISTDTMQAAHRWEFNEVKNYFEEAGAFAIENLLKFLFKHKADYAEWTGSEEFKALDALVFKTAADFAWYFPLAQPFRLFWDFRPLIKEVQDFYVVPAIGADFFTELMADAEPSAEQKAAMIIIKKAVAQYTIIKAIEKRSTQIGTQGFTVKVLGAYSEGVDFDKQDAPDSRLSLLYRACERAGDSYLLQLKEDLNKKASAELFNTYYTSDLYEAPATEKQNPNDNRIGIVGF